MHANMPEQAFIRCCLISLIGGINNNQLSVQIISIPTVDDVHLRRLCEILRYQRQLESPRIYRSPKPFVHMLCLSEGLHSKLRAHQSSQRGCMLAKKNGNIGINGGASAKTAKSASSCSNGQPFKQLIQLRHQRLRRRCP